MCWGNSPECWKHNDRNYSNNSNSLNNDNRNSSHSLNNDNSNNSTKRNNKRRQGQCCAGPKLAPTEAI